jgi:hypothetical protein
MLLATRVTNTHDPLHSLINLAQEWTMTRFDPRHFNPSSCHFYAIDHVLLSSSCYCQIVFTQQITRRDGLPSCGCGFGPERCV